jgi:hypothetical protein
VQDALAKKEVLFCFGKYVSAKAMSKDFLLMPYPQ